MYFTIFLIPGGFVGLFLGYSFFNVILLITDSILIKIGEAMKTNKDGHESNENGHRWFPTNVAPTIPMNIKGSN